MKAMEFQLTEPAHVELRIADRVVVRDYAVGLVKVTSDDDLAAIELVVAAGAASPAKAKAAKAAERSGS